MKKFMPAAAAMLMALTGCGTTQQSLKDAELVPPARRLAFSGQATGGAGTLVVARDKGFPSGKCFTAFYINNVLAARFAVGEAAAFVVPAGEVTLRYAADPEGRGLCTGESGSTVIRETVLRPGEQKQFRLMISGEGVFDIQRAAP